MPSDYFGDNEITQHEKFFRRITDFVSSERIARKSSAACDEEHYSVLNWPVSKARVQRGSGSGVISADRCPLAPAPHCRNRERRCLQEYQPFWVFLLGSKQLAAAVFLSQFNQRDTVETHPVFRIMRSMKMPVAVPNQHP